MTDGDDAIAEPVRYRPIGAIRTAFGKQEGMPIQPCGAIGVRAASR